MTITISVFHSISEVDESEYARLKQACGASIFYDMRFLRATEAAHLLPLLESWYLVAYCGGRMVGFMPSYLQASADPFGVLARTTAIEFGAGNAFFSHIMHCYESTILVSDELPEVRALLLEELSRLARAKGAAYYGILNVLDQNLMASGPALGFQVNYMWDRFYADLSNVPSLERFLATAPRDGRSEMRRQLRKFDDDGRALVTMERPPFRDVQEVAELCYQTTKKNGTPQYYPREAFVRFLELCGDMVGILSISVAGERIGALVCFIEDDTLHLWAGGMIYERTQFSAYTILFVEAIKYALHSGIGTIEAGRTNAKIKGRLGFVPKALYSMIASDSTLEKHR